MIDLSKSSIESVKPCHRAIAFSVVKGLRRVQYTEALLVGKAFHEALAKYYDTRAQEEELLATAAAAIREEQDAEQCVEEAQRLISWYIRNAEDDAWEVVATEIKFRVPVVDGVSLIGVFDLIARVPEFGTVIVDHKTARSVGANYFVNADRDAQVIAYLYAAKSMGIGVDGFLYNVVTKTQKPQLHRYLVKVPDELLGIQIGRLAEFANWVKTLPEDVKGIMSLPPNGLVCRGCPFWELCLEPDKAETTLELMLASGELTIANHDGFGGNDATS